MASNLELALNLTKEEHHNAFERFANAFLVPDYPELEALGGKQDKGMDARIVTADGQVLLVVQSCVSPAGTARTKVLKTVAALKKNGNVPRTLVYCTSATVKLALDETKTELRRDHGITLEVYDAPWFGAREHTSPSRAIVSKDYAREVLDPVLKQLDPNRLYSGVLSDEEERVAIQYLEAHSLDRAQGGNLTKGIYSALVIYTMRGSSAQGSAVTQDQIVDAICKMFPDGHRERIAQVVPGRIKRLANQKTIHFDIKANGYVLSHGERSKLSTKIAQATGRELAFRSALQSAIVETVEGRDIDYDYDIDGLGRTAHACVLWYMHEQGKRFVDPYSDRAGIFNAERLVGLYLKANPTAPGNALLTEQIITDIVPHALYSILSSNQDDIQQYLRAKADIFIIQAFLQVTPDVQEACKKLLGNDIVYLDTTILIRCIAELFSDDSDKRLLRTLRNARERGIQLRTWRPYIDELVSHLRGPVLLEWQNHFKDLSDDEMEPYLRTAPTLIGVFCEHAKRFGGNVASVVAQILGVSNEVENAIEYLKEELSVVTEDMPPVEGDEESALWQKTFGLWLNVKVLKNLTQNRFELLVRNDVSAYAAVVKLRKQLKPEGRNYGHKVWLLTLDRIPWRMPRLLGETPNHIFHVAMSLEYIVNYVATLANTNVVALPGEILPASAILDESEHVPKELRSLFLDEWRKKDERKYVRERHIRDLVHALKASVPVDDTGDDMSVKIEPLKDEDIGV